MRYEAQIKDIYIENAIHLIAEGGFEKATTKNLTHCSGSTEDFKMNEAYIYRIFGSKESLYAEAFNRLDLELYNAFKRGTEKVGSFEENTNEKLKFIFERAWEFILAKPERSKCYIRYCYSIYFRGDSQKKHNELFSFIVEEMKPIFVDEADVKAILHSVFILMFDFAIRVLNGDLVDDEINRLHIFRVLYCMMAPYFKVREI